LRPCRSAPASTVAWPRHGPPSGREPSHPLPGDQPYKWPPSPPPGATPAATCALPALGQRLRVRSPTRTRYRPHPRPRRGPENAGCASGAHVSHVKLCVRSVCVRESRETLTAASA
jgi:hypothetical protein